MGEILIGTSGYYYDDWKGLFYPDNMAKKDYLNYYARYFHTLELNYTYYRLPEAKQSGTMIARAGTDMTFVVKAHKEMTHNITENSISAVLPPFLNGITPFIDSDCLGSILLQFPQSFHYTDKNRIYLKQLIQELLPAPLSVEFRNKDWIKESVYNSLSELNAGFVCVDEPELPNLIPKLNIITSETGYIRFHGRNRENWYGTDSTSRYDYLYSKEELRGWLPLIKEMKDKTEKLFVFFNNHAKSHAVTNAKMLINLLK